MYRSTKSRQVGIFGEGWLYQIMLSQIPEDHPLKKLKPVVDKVLSNIDIKLKKYYSPCEGRPSFSPACLFKMHLLEYLYGLPDVQVSKICAHDILFMWFIGVEPGEPIPDDTTLVKFRSRLKEEGFREIFDEIVKIANKEGFIKGKLRAIDATHIFSDTLKLGPIALIKQGIKKIIKEVKKIYIKAGEQLQEKYKRFLKQPYEKAKEKLEEAQEKGKMFINEVEGIIKLAKYKAGEFKKNMEKRIVDNINVLLDALENVLNGNSLQIVSFTDLDARWGKKSPKKIFGGYKIHTSCDIESGFITNVDILHGNVNESSYLPKMLEEENKKGLEMEGVVCDKLYDTFSNREYLKMKEIKAFIPFRYNHSEIDAFVINDGGVKCNAGKCAIGSVRQENGALFYFSTKDCANCKYKKKCLKKNERRRRVWISDCKRLRNKEYKEKYKYRFIIERKFGEAKKWHRLDRARYRGRWRVAIQALVTFSVTNLKIMSKIVPQGKIK